MQNQKIYIFFNTIISLPYQMAFMLLTSFLLTYMAHIANQHVTTLEVEPQLLYITPKQITQWASSPTPVTAGLYIDNWVEFDLSKNNFTFDGILWFEFDAQIISPDTVDKFSFENAKILEKKKSTKIVNGLLRVEYNVRIQFNTKLVQTMFPFDNHTIFITLTNKSLTPQEAFFKSYRSDFVISENATLVEWIILNQQVSSGYSEGFLNEQNKNSVINNPKAIFSFVVRRISSRTIFVLFLPLFLLFFIGLFGFAFNPSQDATIRNFASASVASIIGYRFVIQSMSPHVGYYVLSDHVFSMVLSLTVIMLMASLIITQFKDEFPALVITRGIIFLFFHAMLLCTWYYLLFIWI